MSGVTVKIIGHLQWGKGVSYHTVYKLLVNKDGTEHIVYRRYSEFILLQQELDNIIENEEMVKQLNDLLPEKVIGGSFSGTVAPVIKSRMKSLDQYLSVLFTVDEIEINNIVITFFDFNNKGVSGIALQVGQSKILRETFAETKLCWNSIGLWGTNFVVLLNTGTLLVLKSIYDNTSSAKINMSLINNDIYFISKPNNILYFKSKSDTNLELYQISHIC